MNIDDANCVLSTDSAVKCFDSEVVNKVCECKTGYAVDESGECKPYCFPEAANHFTHTAAELYTDTNKCTCTNEVDIETCACLAGYVFKDGVCTGEY